MSAPHQHKYIASLVSSKSFWDENFTRTEHDSMFSDTASEFLSEEPCRTVFNGLTECSGGNVRVLEIGAGQGRNGIALAQEYGFHVEATDVSSKGLEYAAKLARDRLGQERAERLYSTRTLDMMHEEPEEGKYDIVLLLFVQFTPDHGALHDKVKRALKPGGYVVVQGFSKRGEQGEQRRSLLYTDDDLRTDFAGFTIHHICDVEKDVSAYGLFSQLPNATRCPIVEFIGQKPAV